MRNFKTLKTWQLGMEIVTETYRMVKDLPKHELYGLRSQMTRAAVSMPSNVAEGCAKSSKRYLRQHLEHALGSAYELETQVMACINLNYFDTEAGNALNQHIQAFQKMTTAFWQRIDEDVKQEEATQKRSRNNKGNS